MERVNPQLECEQAREAISALLDGEEPAAADQAVADHLDGCEPCREWRLTASAATAAAVAGSSAAMAPDLTVRVLAAVSGDVDVTERNLASRGRRQVLRLALAASAVCQLLLAVPLLLMAPSDTGARLGWEVGALTIAVASGFCYAAWRPSAAPGMLSVAGVLALCLLLGGAREVIADPRSIGYHVGHLVAVLQTGLLWNLARTPLPRSQPSPTTARI